QSGELLSGASVTMDGKVALKVVNTNDTPLQVQLLKLPKPGVTKQLYAIEGEVKYEGVRGTGYLEMWNYFPPIKPGMPEGAYFSRSMGDSGELGKITGTSNWRRFKLPFDRTGSTAFPTRLEINLFLPAQGTVYLSQLKLVEYNGSLKPKAAGATNVWWS